MSWKHKFGILAGLVIAGAVAYFAVHALSGNYLSDREKNPLDCSGRHENHQVIIEKATANPTQTYGVLCDKLTITNRDNRIRLISFGEHDRHQTYDGVTQKALGKNQSLTIELNETGTFKFHDHLQDTVQSNFTVTH